MKEYRARTQAVEAFEFTEEVGRIIIIGGAHSPIAPITYEEGRGYRMRGQTLKFGDFVVLSRGVSVVMAKDEFHGIYEELPPPPMLPVREELGLPPPPAAVEAPKPAKRSKKAKAN